MKDFSFREVLELMGKTTRCIPCGPARRFRPRIRFPGGWWWRFRDDMSPGPARM